MWRTYEGDWKGFWEGLCLILSGSKCLWTGNGTVCRLRCLTGRVHLKSKRSWRSQQVLSAEAWMWRALFFASPPFPSQAFLVFLILPHFFRVQRLHLNFTSTECLQALIKATYFYLWLSTRSNSFYSSFSNPSYLLLWIYHWMEFSHKGTKKESRLVVDTLISLGSQSPCRVCGWDQMCGYSAEEHERWSV